jgi:hypothetical protein
MLLLCGGVAYNKAFLKEVQRMDWEKATRIAYAIGGSRLQTPRVELFRRAVAYAHLRACWQLSTVEERHAMDAERTVAHDAFIEACATMARAMAEEQEDCSWHGELGDDRKEIGDFACYVHLILGLVAR